MRAPLVAGLALLLALIAAPAAAKTAEMSPVAGSLADGHKAFRDICLAHPLDPEAQRRISKAQPFEMQPPVEPIEGEHYVNWPLQLTLAEDGAARVCAVLVLLDEPVAPAVAVRQTSARLKLGRALPEAGQAALWKRKPPGQEQEIRLGITSNGRSHYALFALAARKAK